MRYTKDDYNHAIVALRTYGPRWPELAPQERRLIDAVRIAYVMHADVPLSEVKNARALLNHYRPRPS